MRKIPFESVVIGLKQFTFKQKHKIPKDTNLYCRDKKKLRIVVTNLNGIWELMSFIASKECDLSLVVIPNDTKWIIRISSREDIWKTKRLNC